MRTPNLGPIEAVCLSRADKKRLRKHAKAAAEGRPMRTNTMGRTPAQKATHKREYKHQQRVKAAVKAGRVLVRRRCNRPPPQDAHVAAYVVHKQKTQLHDAHVHRANQVVKARAASLARYHASSVNLDLKRSKRSELHDSYVILKLQSLGIPRAEITNQLINLKREQLALRRLALELKSAAKKIFKEQYERLTKNA